MDTFYANNSIEVIINSSISDLESSRNITRTVEGVKKKNQSKRQKQNQNNDQQHYPSLAGVVEEENDDENNSFTTHDMSHSDVDDDIEQEKMIFDKARQYLTPGIFFRFFTYLYSERKLLVFFWIHFMCTMTVWSKYICANHGTLWVLSRQNN